MRLEPGQISFEQLVSPKDSKDPFLLKREKQFRRESIKGKSAWKETIPVNPSADPYIPSKQTLFLRERKHHKERP